MTITERIQAAIRPVLERADRVIWEIQNPRTAPGRRAHVRGNRENPDLV